MEWSLECATVVPCFNEEATIASVISGIRHYLPTVFVVDDGSRDRTAAFALQSGVEVLCHETNRGKGAALQSGWRAALDRGFQWALSLDGDGQHSAEDIPSFFHAVERSSALLVVGNRMTNAAGMPLVRRQVNRWMSRRLSQIGGIELPDSQCGFRLMNLKAWHGLSIQTAHFEIESEVLLGFIAAKHRVEFVPIAVIYKNEQSKIHPLRDTLRWFRWWRGVRRSGH